MRVAHFQLEELPGTGQGRLVVSPSVAASFFMIHQKNHRDYTLSRLAYLQKIWSHGPELGFSCKTCWSAWRPT